MILNRILLVIVEQYTELRSPLYLISIVGRRGNGGFTTRRIIELCHLSSKPAITLRTSACSLKLLCDLVRWLWIVIRKGVSVWLVISLFLSAVMRRGTLCIMSILYTLEAFLLWMLLDASTLLDPPSAFFPKSGKSIISTPIFKWGFSHQYFLCTAIWE